jgi:hypothetical protein
MRFAKGNEVNHAMLYGNILASNEGKEKSGWRKEIIL